MAGDHGDGGRLSDGDQACTAQVQGVECGIFDGGCDFGFVLQLAQLVAELAGGGAVVRWSEEPAIDEFANAFVHEGEGEQQEAGQQNDKECMYRAGGRGLAGDV